MSQVSIDVVGLVDEWAARFFEELDYVNEGENGTFFAEMMRKDLPQVRPLTFSLLYVVVCFHVLKVGFAYQMPFEYEV